VRAAALALLCVAAATAGADEARVGTLVIHDAWARPTPPGISVGAVYLRISNQGAQADRLVGVRSPAAASGEIHETRSQGGTMQMRPVAALACPAGATVSISPGGVHIMLVGLKQPLIAGTSVPLTLTFQGAGSVTLGVPVQTRD
jgi:copper(I)-binding protein